MSRVEVPAALERGTRREKAASRKMATRGDMADLIAAGERERSRRCSNWSCWNWRCGREKWRCVLTALHSWEAVECKLKTEARFYTECEAETLCSVINQRQCHEQYKLGGTLCLVLLVTSHTVIHRNIDTQTFNDYKLVNPYVSVW